MIVRGLLLAACVFLLAGCDKLTGEADQQVADAEAVGFACRVSSKLPGDCMRDNDSYSPSHILDGWKYADEDIKAGKLDPSMKAMSSMASETPPAKEGEVQDGVPAQDEEPAESPDAAAEH